MILSTCGNSSTSVTSDIDKMAENDNRRQSLILEDILEGGVDEDELFDNTRKEAVFFPSSYKSRHSLGASYRQEEKKGSMDLHFSTRQQLSFNSSGSSSSSNSQVVVSFFDSTMTTTSSSSICCEGKVDRASVSERTFHPLPSSSRRGSFEKAKRSSSASPTSASLWTSVGAAASEWFTFNDDELAEIQKKEEERLELKRIQDARAAEERKLKQEQAAEEKKRRKQEQQRLLQQQQQLQENLDQVGPLTSSIRLGRSEKTSNGRRGLALIGKSGRIVMNLVKGGGMNGSNRRNSDSPSNSSYSASFDEMQALRRDICKTRKAVHEAVAEMDTGSEDWRKLQRALRQQHAYTNVGAHIALGHLIVDAALHQEDKPLNPLRDRLSFGRSNGHLFSTSNIETGSPRRGSTGKRECFAASKLARATKEHLSQSLSQSLSTKRSNLKAPKDGDCACPSLVASMNLSITDNESNGLDSNDSFDSSFSLHELLQTASTKRLEAMFFADENGIDQRTGQHYRCPNRSASLNFNSTISASTCKTESFSSAGSWNEFDMRMSQLNQSNKGPAWVVVDRKFRLNAKMIGSSRSVRMGSDFSSSHQQTAQIHRNHGSVSRGQRRHSNADQPFSAPTIVGRARGALARTMTYNHNANPGGWNKDLSSDVSKDVISESDLSDEEKRQLHKGPARRRRGALTGAPEDDAQKEIATALYAKQAHYSHSSSSDSSSSSRQSSSKQHKNGSFSSEESGTTVQDTSLVPTLAFGSLPRKKIMMANQA